MAFNTLTLLPQHTSLISDHWSLIIGPASEPPHNFIKYFAILHGKQLGLFFMIEPNGRQERKSAQG